MLFGQRHDDMSGGHTGFFVSQRDVLAGFDRRDGRLNPDHADYGSHHCIRLRLGRQLDEAGHAAHHADIGIRQARFEHVRLTFVVNRDEGRAEFPRLLFSQIDGPAAAQRRHLKQIGMHPDDVEGLGSDGAG